MDVVLNHHLVDADDHPDMERAILELSRNVRGILTGAPTSLPPGNVVRLHETQPSLIKDLVHLFDSLVKLQFSVGVMKFEEHDLEMLQQCVAASNEIKVGMEMSREKTKEKERQQ
jgi:hypothetical protein